MNFEVELLNTFAVLTQALHDFLESLLPADQGYLVVWTTKPAPSLRMPVGAKAGPDRYAAPPPEAREAFLEAWHSNFSGEYFRVAQARLRTSSSGAPRKCTGCDAACTFASGCDGDEGELCTLSWETDDLRIDFRPYWQKLLQMVVVLWGPNLDDARLKGDDGSGEPAVLDTTTLYVSLGDADAATGKVLAEGFAPGFLRYERLAERRGGGDLVRYRIKGDPKNLDDDGEIWLCTGGRQLTTVTLCLLKVSVRQPRPGPHAPIVPTEPVRRLADQLRPYVAEIADIADSTSWDRKQAILEGEVWPHYLASLPEQWLSPKRALGAGEVARLSRSLSERDRSILDQWNEGRPARAIGNALGLTDGRVSTIVSELRQRLGEDVVPLSRSRPRSCE